MADYSGDFGDLGSGMDAFGGYGADLGLSGPSTGAFDYFGTNQDVGNFSSISGDFSPDWAGGMSMADWANPNQTVDGYMGVSREMSYDPNMSPSFTDGLTDSAPSQTDFMDEFSRFSRSPLGRMLSLTPAGKALGVVSALGQAGKGNFGPAIGKGVSALTGNPLAGTVANIGTQAAQGRNVAGPVGATIGGLFGSQSTGTQLGGLVGSQLGGMIGQSVGSTGRGGQTSGTNVGNQGMDFGGALANLADIYSSNRASRDIGRNVSSMQANSPQVSLESLYGPDSPYAAQLRQQLERKDAAAGRRSQYGPREVELQARLADMYSRAAPNFMQANVMNQNAIAQQQALQAQRRNQTLASIYGLARSSGVLRGIGNTFQNSGINNSLNYIDNIVPDNSLNNYIPSDVQEWM
jgi:hypothetical protein